MIIKITGHLSEIREQSVVLNVHGLYYEIITPHSVIQRLEEVKTADGEVTLVTHHYLQIGPASGAPLLIGFLTEIEKDFFLQFIKVSGIGPRAAVKALNKPISEITQAIDAGDLKYLKTLSGIGLQRAKEIVAKLQGKVARFGLIQDGHAQPPAARDLPHWQEEAMDVLTQLQYKKPEAVEMIEKALARCPDVCDTEGLLNEIYKQRVKA